MGEQSFLSFEGALQYHNLFDQGLKSYRSISKKQYLAKTVEGIKYSYIRVKEDKYFGFEEKRVDDLKVKIATQEMAVLDLIEYQRTVFTISLVIEKLTNYQNEFDIDLLMKYIKNYSQITIKTMGLIFDAKQIDSSKLMKLLNNHNSTHRLFKDDSAYNSKWRLYYNSILDNDL
jgi:predicted transcriptional regulator of viral defense system